MQPIFAHLPTADLIPYARNSRTHSDEQVGQIMASMQEFGFTNPILLDEDKTIIAGHGRLMAAKRLGLTEVPTVTLPGLTSDQRRALVIADNSIAANSGWDLDMLRLEVGELGAANFNLDLLAFTDDFLADLLNPPKAGLTDPDEIPPVPERPVSVLGDVWILGKHRIICGDSTDPHAVATVLDGVEPHLMVTDPPYGVEYKPEWRDQAAGKTGPTGTAKGQVLNDDKADWTEAWALFPGDVAYVWHAGLFAGVVGESLSRVGFHLRSQIIWAKSSLVMSRGDYHWQHEPCWYAVRKGRKGHYEGGRKQSTLWQIDKPVKSETGHGTQKPVECMKRPIENNSNPGQAVYEPFSGSGTTLIAAEMSGRVCLAVELNPAYVDVAVARWEGFTGQTAYHAETGQTFGSMKADRHQEAAA